MDNKELVKTLKTASQSVGDNMPLQVLLTMAAARIKEMTEVISNAYVSIKVGMPEFNLDDALDILEPFVKENTPGAFDDTVPGELEKARVEDVGYHISLLEKYSRVKASIESMWGTERCRKYLVGLVIDDRDRPNSKVQGFSPEVLTTLSTLLELHDKFYPQHKPKQNLWDSSFLT
jgi:hypothetical protein